MSDEYNDRLNRIEKKIDDLASALVSIARTEEKLTSIEKNYYQNYERQNRMAQKIDAVEKKADNNERMAKMAMRLFWIVITGSIAAALATKVAF